MKDYFATLTSWCSTFPAPSSLETGVAIRMYRIPFGQVMFASNEQGYNWMVTADPADVYVVVRFKLCYLCFDLPSHARWKRWTLHCAVMSMLLSVDLRCWFPPLLPLP